jgi:hypothetical protein
MPTRTYNLRFLRGSYDYSDATYGVSTYGADNYTYGQEASQSILAGVNYELLPSPGWHPAEPEWVYRIGDETRFASSVVDHDNPSDSIDVSTVTAAQLFLTLWSFGSVEQTFTYDLTPNLTEDTLDRYWLQTDLQTEGRFRVNIHIEFDSGRSITVEGADSVSLFVNSGPDR